MEIKEKKIAYSKLELDKNTAIVMIEDALVEIKKDGFYVQTLELSAPLVSIINAVKTLYQVAYANSLVVIEKPEIHN